MTDAVRKKHWEVNDMHQDAKEIDVSTKEFDLVRSKDFNFHSVQSVIIAKLKTNN